jgi:DNA-binding cell septation regulator SpoVG
VPRQDILLEILNRTFQHRQHEPFFALADAFVIHPLNDCLSCFMVREIRVIRDTGGLFVSFPVNTEKDGSYRLIALPANAETRNMIEQAVLAEYEKVIAQADQKLSEKNSICRRQHPAILG